MPRIGVDRAVILALGVLIALSVALADAAPASPGALTLIALGVILLARRPLIQST